MALNVRSDRKAFFSGIHHETSVRPNVIASRVKSATNSGVSRTLDFHCPQVAISMFNYQIDFRAAARTIKRTSCSAAEGCEKRLHDKSLPTHPNDWMSGQRRMGCDAQQCVHNSAVANVDLWRFHEAFSNIGEERGKPSHEQKIGKQIDIAHDRLRADFKSTSQFRCVQRTALPVSEHGPQAFERSCWNAWSEHGDVAFEIGPYKVVSPSEADFIGVREKAQREPATKPKPFSCGVLIVNLVCSERRQVLE